MGKAVAAAAVAGVVFAAAVIGVPVLLVAGLLGAAQACPPPAGGAGSVRGATGSPLVAARAARAAGFPPVEWVTAVAVAGGESGWDPAATNRNSDGSVDYGEWQINSVHAALLRAHDWRDPAASAVMAVTVWRASGWAPWVAYTSGRYRQFLPAARAAVAQLGGPATISPPAPTGTPAAVAVPAGHVPAGAGCTTTGTTAAGVPAWTGGPAGRSGMATAGIACAAGTDSGVTTGPGGVRIRLCTVGGITVNTTRARNLARLLAAAAGAGLRLGGGGFRGEAEQIALRRAHCGPTSDDIWRKPSGQCAPPTAIPGQSMHEWGLAIDVTSGGSIIGSHSDPAWQWLTTHAATYGLHPLSSEPWHWSTDGR